MKREELKQLVLEVLKEDQFSMKSNIGEIWDTKADIYNDLKLFIASAIDSGESEFFLDEVLPALKQATAFGEKLIKSSIPE